MAGAKGSSKKYKQRSILEKFKKTELPLFERPAPAREERQKILIYCEGKNTEPSYFKKFRLSTATIEVFGKGRNTKSLVEQAIKLKKTSSYDQVWCVFDSDDFGIRNFNEAVKLAEQNGIGVAYSIQAFEYWLLLHFEDHQGGAMHRNQYNFKLNHYLAPLGAEYDGVKKKLISAEFFELLVGIDPATAKPRTTLAIQRAKRIYDQYDHTSPGTEESSTTVFRLVEEIQKFC